MKDISSSGTEKMEIFFQDLEENRTQIVEESILKLNLKKMFSNNLNNN